MGIKQPQWNVNYNVLRKPFKFERRARMHNSLLMFTQKGSLTTGKFYFGYAPINVKLLGSGETPGKCYGTFFSKNRFHSV